MEYGNRYPRAGDYDWYKGEWFSDRQMQIWFVCGYFPQNLALRTRGDSKYTTLFQLNQQLNGSPFLGQFPAFPDKDQLNGTEDAPWLSRTVDFGTDTPELPSNGIECGVQAGISALSCGGGDRSYRTDFRSTRENPRPSNCLGIFGMSMNTKERHLREIFEQYGRIDSVKVIMDRETGRSRGYGFVDFKKRSDATMAREKISDTVIDGMKVRVDYAQPKRC